MPLIALLPGGAAQGVGAAAPLVLLSDIAHSSLIAHTVGVHSGRVPLRQWPTCPYSGPGCGGDGSWTAVPWGAEFNLTGGNFIATVFEIGLGEEAHWWPL